MEVKTILSKIRQKEGQPLEYYFALEIGLEFVKSAIFAVIENQVKVLSLGSVERWESEEELIEATDATLSAAAEKLPIEGAVKEPDKVVFGLPFNWIEGDKIVEAKLGLLKKLSEKLDLKPTGFVVITEAIIHHLRTTEGVPPTAILVHLGKKKINVGLVKIGKISGPQLIDKSEDLASDLIEGLSRFETKEPLPARVLLYDAEEKLEDAKQQLISYPWLEKKKEGVEFLHLPKVEILSLNFDIEAIALAGGKEVAKAEGLVLEERPLEKEEEEVAEETPEEEKKPEEKAAAPGFVAAGTLGFVKGKDVAERKTPVEAEKPEEPVEPTERAEPTEPIVPEKPPEAKEPPVIKEPPLEKPAKESFITKITSFLPSLPASINLAFFKGLMPKGKKASPIMILIIVALVLIFGGAFAAYWYFPRAEVTLFLEPEVLEKDFTVTLDPTTGTPDKEEFILPAQQVGVEVEGTKSKGTTGAKDIGDPAKGEVTVFNGTSNEKTFDSGTVIASGSGLEFSLDDDVTVASQSSAADPPGQAKVNVTAVEIGTEGNLAANTEFTIANYAKSDYVAKNESAFSGGVSRQIQAVAEEDQEALLADLKASLEKDAQEKLIAQISGEDKLVEESIESKVVSSNYSHEVGDEADNLELTLKIKANALIYTEKELQELVGDSVRESVPEGFEYVPEETEFSFELGEVDEDGKATVKVHLKAELIPQLDLEQIRKNLTGKYLPIGETYLGNLPRVAGFEAKISPRLPGRLGTFPRVSNKIEIKTEVR